MEKKAQIKMFENLAVMIVFFFLLIFGAAFYFRLQENAIQRETQLSLELRAVQIAQKSLNAPELRCPFPYAERRDCIDLDKAKAFRDFLETDPNARTRYLENSFGLSTITVNLAYSAARSPEAVTFWNESSFARSEESIATQIPMVVYSGADDRRGLGFGFVEVRIYG